MGPLVVEVQAKAVPISESEKFRQHLFFPLHHPLQLQLECLGELVLDQFHALNPPVTSICPWDRWLLRNKWKHSRVKNSGQYFHPSIKHNQPRIRKATEDVSRPI